MDCQLTNFSDNTGDNQLLLASSLDSSAEVGVVPSVDFTLATNERGIGVQVSDLLQHETVRTLVRRAGQDSGEVEDVSKRSVANDVVTEVVCVVITNDLRKTDLVVNDKKGLEKVRSEDDSRNHAAQLTALSLSSLFHA